jgi:hypothetical protein
MSVIYWYGKGEEQYGAYEVRDHVHCTYTLV